VTRRRLAGLLAATCLLGAAACTGATPKATGGSVGEAEAAEAPQLPVTVPSADGRPVTVSDISRIVPLWGNITEVVFGLGLGDRVVGRDVATTFEEAAKLPVVTRGHDVSAESVLSLKPTLVLANADTGPPEALEQIRNVGVPVLVLDNPQRVQDIEERIHAIAAALGVPAAGDRIAATARRQIRAEQARIPEAATRPKVAFLYVRGQAGVYLIAGPGSGADSMIEAAGGVDAGAAEGLSRSFTPITSEALVEAAPDVLLLTTTGLESVGGIDGLLDIPGVAQTPAGRDRRVITVEDGLLYSFGSRTPQALRTMIDQIYGLDDDG
jgi:iron complex transport system substrate-binding protein